VSLFLVTGGAGFIGSNIVAALCEAGHRVAVCDVLGEAASGKWKNLAKHPIDDLILPEGALYGWLAENARDLEAIIHMGAVSSTTEPDADLILNTNFGLSRTLWHWATAQKKRFIYASSAATYGDGSQGFDDAPEIAALQALRPLNAYGWSKALFDLHAAREAGDNSKPPQWVGLKFFNVYGPNEYHKGGMRSVVDQIWPRIAADEAVTLFKSHNPAYADGGQMRDFVHVDDCVAVILWLLDHPEVSGLYNLGTGRARSFVDLARAAFAAAGREPRIDYVETPEPLRAQYQYFTEARMDRLRTAGYTSPFIELEAGVADYVRRFLSQPDRYR
jgi:ADP-L-glycero-D-manno-heptose 6-epimerase